MVVGNAQGSDAELLSIRRDIPIPWSGERHTLYAPTPRHGTDSSQEDVVDGVGVWRWKLHRRLVRLTTAGQASGRAERGLIGWAASPASSAGLCRALGLGGRGRR